MIWACSGAGHSNLERLWRRTSTGGWEALSRTGQAGGLPNVIVTGVDFYRPNQKVRIATLGRGVWEAPTSALGAQRAPAAAILFPSEGTQVPVGGSIQYVGKGLSALAGGMVTYRWSWGDQSPDSFGASVPHVFRRYGAYPVKLTVSDGSGASITVARPIVVRRRGGLPPGGGGVALPQGTSSAPPSSGTRRAPRSSSRCSISGPTGRSSSSGRG